MNSGIYKIINLVNNKFYIGSSTKLNYRKYKHFRDLKSQRHDNSKLQRAFNKYGENSFKFEILARCPIEYLIKLEQWFLDNLKPHYNILQFAYTTLGYKHNKETRLKMSKIQKGIKHTKEQIRNATKTRFKKVYQYKRTGEFINSFESVLEAGNKIGVDRTNIAFVCRNPRRKNGTPRLSSGYLWSYFPPVR